MKTSQTAKFAFTAAIVLAIVSTAACGTSTDEDAAAVKTTLESFYAAAYGP